MREIRARVAGLPPKKDGANSMWRKPREAARIVALRKAVLAAMQGGGPLRSDISLELVIHLAGENSRTTGDLDNFITGVCDGLQAAARNTPWASTEVWTTDSEEIRPNRSIAIEDDAAVVAIRASKLADDTDEPWYEVTLRGR